MRIDFDSHEVAFRDVLRERHLGGVHDDRQVVVTVFRQHFTLEYRVRIAAHRPNDVRLLDHHAIVIAGLRDGLERQFDIEIGGRRETEVLREVHVGTFVEAGAGQQVRIERRIFVGRRFVGEIVVDGLVDAGRLELRGGRLLHRGSRADWRRAEALAQAPAEQQQAREQQGAGAGQPAEQRG